MKRAWAPDPDSLRGRIAVVAGATRGAGRGIAAALGEAGATVICTGRTTRREGAARSDYDRPETIDETAELVTRLGGTGIAVPADHLDPEEVGFLAARLQTRARPDRHPGERHLGSRGPQGRSPGLEHPDLEA